MFDRRKFLTNSILAIGSCSLNINRHDLRSIHSGSHNTVSWDLNTALGDTIKEKYNSLYAKIDEISHIAQDGKYNWIVTSSEIASIFITDPVNFELTTSKSPISAFGFQYIGIFKNRWKLYIDSLLSQNQILVG